MNGQEGVGNAGLGRGQILFSEERIGGEIEGEYAFIIENEKGEILDTAVFKNGKKI